MALGGHDTLDEQWPTRWAERFVDTVALHYPGDLFDRATSAWGLAGVVGACLGGCCGRYLIEDALAQVFRRCESPIEQALLATLILEIANSGYECAIWGSRIFEYAGPHAFVRLPELACSRSARGRCVDGLMRAPARLGRFLVYPQLKLGAYRADLFVVFEDLLPGDELRARRTMVIECDGHEFHEKSKEQATADKARDRYMQARGHLAFRFTGSDIWRDAVACARETLSVLTKGRA